MEIAKNPWEESTNKIAFYPYTAYPIPEKVFKYKLDDLLRLLIQNGQFTFICNPQAEIDYWFLQVIINLRMEFPHVRILLFTIYPFYQQYHAPILDSRKGQKLLQISDWSGYFSTKKCSSTVKKKYMKFLVQQASAIISVLPRHLKGRTGLEKCCALEHTLLYDLREREIVLSEDLYSHPEKDSLIKSYQRRD